MNKLNSLSIIDNTDIDSFKNTMGKIQQFQRLVRENLIEGKDYGTIPGTQKPTLYKAGAEKIVILGKLRSTFDILSEIKDYEKEFFDFEIRWNLWAGDNLLVQGVGLCNSKEDKYRYRWITEKKIPANIDKEKLLFRIKTGKYGTYKEYRMVNEDICTLANTILKMAKKRALVDAALLVGSLSDLFTQDIEDFPETMVEKVVEGISKQIEETAKITKKEVIKEALKTPLDTYLHKDEPELTTKEAIEAVFPSDFKPATEKQKNWIYGKTEGDGKHITGIVKSHLIKKAEVDQLGEEDELSFDKANNFIGWWVGNKEKGIVGEREKRGLEEKKEAGKVIPKSKKDILIDEIRDLTKSKKIPKSEVKKIAKLGEFDTLMSCNTSELEIVLEWCKQYGKEEKNEI